MTYKKIVESMLRTSAEQWVKDLMRKNLIGYRWIDSDTPHMEARKDDILYDVKITVTMFDYQKKTLFVGGCVDDYIGISNSVIWDENGHILWMAVEKTRESLGITEFKIA